MARKELQFAGVVDAYALGVDWHMGTGITIADRDVIGEVEAWLGGLSYVRRANVRVYLGVEPVAEGEWYSIHGFCGTDVTPPEMPEITVGDVDLLDRLRDLDGREVLLIVEDINGL